MLTCGGDEMETNTHTHTTYFSKIIIRPRFLSCKILQQYFFTFFFNMQDILVFFLILFFFLLRFNKYEI